MVFLQNWSVHFWRKFQKLILAKTSAYVWRCYLPTTMMIPSIVHEAVEWWLYLNLPGLRELPLDHIPSYSQHPKQRFLRLQQIEISHILLADIARIPGFNKEYLSLNEFANTAATAHLVMEHNVAHWNLEVHNTNILDVMGLSFWVWATYCLGKLMPKDYFNQHMISNLLLTTNHKVHNLDDGFPSLLLSNTVLSIVLSAPS